MDNREKIIDLISDLKKAFPETQDSVFEILLKRLTERKYSDSAISHMVNYTIDHVKKARITVADVLNETDDSNDKQYQNLCR